MGVREFAARVSNFMSFTENSATDCDILTFEFRELTSRGRYSGRWNRHCTVIFASRAYKGAVATAL